MVEWLIVVILLVLLIWGFAHFSGLSRELQEVKREYEALVKEFDRRVAAEANALAQRMYEEWVNTKVREIEKQVEEKYRVLFEEYKMRWEKEIRKDAISRSVSVLLGKISEHIAPLLMAEKLGVNPKDLRFLGTPIDYVAFKGLSDGKPEEVLFIEVKSSKTGSLTPREQAVKRLVDAKKVRWVTFNLYDIIEETKRRAEEEIARMQVLGGAPQRSEPA